MKAKAISTIRTTPAESGTERNMASGMSGSRTFFWESANTKNRTTAAPRKPRVLASPQPHSEPLMSDQIRQNIACDSSTMPPMSKDLAAFSARWSLRITRPKTSAITPTGTLMKKTDCQLTCSTSTPPRMGPCGGRGADHHAPDADRHVQLLGGEGGAQQAERRGHQQGAEEALEHTEDDHRRHAVGEADGRRGRGESGDAYQEGLAVAEAVTELARGDQGDRECEHVAVGDPLDVGERGAEVLLDRGVGDRDDRAVERNHHHADGDGEERQPGVAAQPFRRCGNKGVFGLRGAFSTVV